MKHSKWAENHKDSYNYAQVYGITYQGLKSRDAGSLEY